MRMGVDARRSAAEGVVSLAARGGSWRSLRPRLVLAVVLGGAAALSGCDAPRLDAALLKPQPPPKCDAKTRSAAQKQTATADADGEAGKLRQLDYEAQCYRHAEMIARSRLGRLQESVQDMVRAAKPAPSAVP